MRLGLVVNPFAGLGGPAALRGSDGPGTAEAALALGAVPRAGERAARCVEAMRRRAGPGAISIVTGPGALGADLARGAEVIALDPSGTARDTRDLAEAMQGRVDLILVAGGDGTARDAASANRTGIPILGIPAGVKMHSGIFARTPEAAGIAAADFLSDPGARTELAEILDLDEEARRAGRLSARLHMVARTPAARGLRQATKAGAPDPTADLDAAIAEYAREAAAAGDRVIGPGTTMMALKDRLGGGTLLGVDLARGGRIVARDLTEAQLLAEARAPLRIALGIVGGQGFLLGRGNQQIGPELIRRAEGIDVIGAAEKLTGLEELSVDTGDAALDASLRGYLQVRTGPRRRQVMRVA